MIDNFLGMDTDVRGGGWGWGDDFFLFLKDRSSLQYFITQGGSEFYVPYLSHYM